MTDRGSNPTLWNIEHYRIKNLACVMTPALAIYPKIVQNNIEQTVRLLNGNAESWRPHVKTAKLKTVMRMLTGYGVKHLKCATTLELSAACNSGAHDVLLAHSPFGANARRTRQIADEFPNVRVSTLVESPRQIALWTGSRVSLFIDLNPGMDRTGIGQSKFEDIATLARAIRNHGLECRGLHYYDGHLHTSDKQERVVQAHCGYAALLDTVRALETEGIVIEEVITSGTPTLPAALAFAGFKTSAFSHRVSPGTIVYCDTTSLQQLPADYDYRPAAIVLSRVVSHPQDGIVTCDAGHKAVSVDAGVPNCAVIGRPDFRPLQPSEEHLPIAVPATNARPDIGEVLYLVPRHVCPTVNNFDQALFIRDGQIESRQNVSARGHEETVLAVRKDTDAM